jgi:hypothetical protein
MLTPAVELALEWILNLMWLNSSFDQRKISV